MKKNLLAMLGAVMLMAACDELGSLDRPTSLEELSETLQANNAAIAKALQARDCETVRDVLDRNPRSLPVDRATLLMEGRCFEQDPAQAAQILDKIVVPSTDDYNARARLGALYETGEGVDQDLARAQTLYRRALGQVGLDWVQAQARENQEYDIREMKEDMPELNKNRRFIEALFKMFDFAGEAARLWNVSVEEAIYGFMMPASGPWALPPILQDEINAVRPLIEGGGPEAFIMAERFKEGRDGYPIDDVLASQWVQWAAVDKEYLPARRAYAQWGSDPNFCDSDEPGCWRNAIRFNSNLIELARLGDVPAIDALSTCVQAAPDSDHKPLQVYLWLQLRLRYGLPVDEATLQAADEALSVEYQPVRRALEVFGLSAQEFKQISRDWEIKAVPIIIRPFSDEVCALRSTP